MQQVYGLAYNRRDSITYRDRFEKRNREYYLKQEEIIRVQKEIDETSRIYFKKRTDAQDQYLYELQTYLSDLTGAA